mgnify:CR=1 FL=1
MKHLEQNLKKQLLQQTKEIEKLSFLIKSILNHGGSIVHPPHITAIEKKYEAQNSLIPEGHPDRVTLSTYITKLNGSGVKGSRQAAWRLSDKLLTGGGDLTRDKNPPLQSNLNLKSL